MRCRCTKSSSNFPDKAIDEGCGYLQASMRHNIKHIASCLFLLLVFIGHGQSIGIKASGDTQHIKIGNARYSSRQEANFAIQKIYSDITGQGFLDATIDTSFADSAYYLNIREGNQYNIREIIWRTDSTVREDVNTFTYRKNNPLSDALIQDRANMIISEFENRGFPFARAVITGLSLDQNDASIVFDVDPGPKILMDSLAIRSNSKLPLRYIRNYIEFKSGEAYKEEKVLRTEKRLREIPFVTIRQPSEIRFNPGEADLFVFLEKKKANFFNGIVGVRPNDQTGKINITGDAEIKLLNAFNGGEEFYLNWRKMQAQTQDLTVRTLLPYLFSTPVGIDGQLKIYKRDSTFTSVKTGAGLVLNIGGNNRIRLFAEKNSTSQLSTVVSALPLANVNSTLYGLSMQIERLDYRFNPQKGFSVLLEGATGIRKVNATNLTTEQTNGATPGKNIHRIEGIIDYYIPTFKRQCILISAKGSGIFTSSIFENEMYRIGGLRTMRGVDEESIFSTSYAIGTIEYRLLFEENSALYVFVDQGWYEKKGASTFVTDMPIGFGAGVNFETKAGIFTFNYALGQQFENPLLVRNAKISFGFRNIF